MEILETNKKTWTIGDRHYHCKLVNVKDLCRIDDNTNADEKVAMMALLNDRIPKEGMLHPLIVTDKDVVMWKRHTHKISPEAKYVIWYGNNRYQYAIENGYDMIDCLILNHSILNIRDELCNQMNIKTRANEINSNKWLKEGRKLLEQSKNIT
tara:strand:+ start:1582 stop:2040 length:459 start_codon:yes stop_codon:yes gene_type:complete